MLLASSSSRRFPPHSFSACPEMSVLLVPMIGKELFTALTFLIRERPQAAVGTFQARFAAYAGSFLLMGSSTRCAHGVPRVSRSTPCPRSRPSVGCSGWPVRCWWASPYGRSGMRSASSQKLATSSAPVRTICATPRLRGVCPAGPGIWLIYPSIVLAAGIAIWFGLTLTRMHFEERILMQAFPEYESYKRRTGAVSHSVRVSALGPSTLTPVLAASGGIGNQTSAFVRRNQ